MERLQRVGQPVVAMFALLATMAIFVLAGGPDDRSPLPTDLEHAQQR